VVKLTEFSGKKQQPYNTIGIVNLIIHWNALSYAWIWLKA